MKFANDYQTYSQTNSLEIDVVSLVLCDNSPFLIEMHLYWQASNFILVSLTTISPALLSNKNKVKNCVTDFQHKVFSFRLRLILQLDSLTSNCVQTLFSHRDLYGVHIWKQ